MSKSSVFFTFAPCNSLPPTNRWMRLSRNGNCDCRRAEISCSERVIPGQFSECSLREYCDHPFKHLRKLAFWVCRKVCRNLVRLHPILCCVVIERRVHELKFRMLVLHCSLHIPVAHRSHDRGQIACSLQNPRSVVRGGHRYY